MRLKFAVSGIPRKFRLKRFDVNKAQSTPVEASSTSLLAEPVFFLELDVLFFVLADVLPAADFEEFFADAVFDAVVFEEVAAVDFPESEEFETESVFCEFAASVRDVASVPAAATAMSASSSSTGSENCALGKKRPEPA